MLLLCSCVFAFLLSGVYAGGALSEWNAVIKTCDTSGAGTDASVYLKIYYQTEADQESFYLNSAGDDFERGQRDRFALTLRHNDLINIGLYYWPSGTIGEAWCVDWVILTNAGIKKCFVAIFDKWIGYYSDPPTYPRSFRSSDFSKCIH